MVRAVLEPQELDHGRHRLVSAVAANVQGREGTGTILETASAAGLILWVVTFRLLAHVFGWVRFPNGTNPLVRFVAHTVFFGTVLGLAPSRLPAVQAEA